MDLLSEQVAHLVPLTAEEHAQAQADQLRSLYENDAFDMLADPSFDTCSEENDGEDDVESFLSYEVNNGHDFDRESLRDFLKGMQLMGSIMVTLFAYKAVQNPMTTKLVELFVMNFSKMQKKVREAGESTYGRRAKVMWMICMQEMKRFEQKAKMFEARRMKILQQEQDIQLKTLGYQCKSLGNFPKWYVACLNTELAVTCHEVYNARRTWYNGEKIAACRQVIFRGGITLLEYWRSDYNFAAAEVEKTSYVEVPAAHIYGTLQRNHVLRHGVYPSDKVRVERGATWQMAGIRQANPAKIYHESSSRRTVSLPQLAAFFETVVGPIVYLDPRMFDENSVIEVINISNYHQTEWDSERLQNEVEDPEKLW